MPTEHYSLLYVISGAPNVSDEPHCHWDLILETRDLMGWLIYVLGPVNLASSPASHCPWGFTMFALLTYCRSVAIPLLNASRDWSVMGFIGLVSISHRMKTVYLSNYKSFSLLSLSPPSPWGGPGLVADCSICYLFFSCKPHKLLQVLDTLHRYREPDLHKCPTYLAYFSPLIVMDVLHSGRDSKLYPFYPHLDPLSLAVCLHLVIRAPLPALTCSCHYPLADFSLRLQVGGLMSPVLHPTHALVLRQHKWCESQGAILHFWTTTPNGQQCSTPSSCSKDPHWCW